MSHTIFDFCKNLTWEAIPPDVQHQTKRCLLDLISAAADTTAKGDWDNPPTDESLNKNTMI